MRDLAVDPAVVWRRLGLVALVLALLAAAVLLTRPAGDAERRCPAAADLLAAVWHPAAAAAARDGLLATGLSYAPATWPQVEAEIGAWAAAWTAARDEACAATHVHREASEDLLHLRGQCLDADLRDLDALLGTLATADAATVEHALAAAQDLP